jgi:hypothetical protein
MKEPFIPPECRPTLERIQAVLDRVHPASIVSADPHPASCEACCERVRAAQRMLDLFAEPVSVRPGFADSVLAEVAHEHKRLHRRKTAAVFGGFALAASVALAFAVNQPQEIRVAKQQTVPVPQPALPPPIRVNDELAKAGEAFRESTRPITEPAANAPRMVAALTETLFNTPAVPMGYDLGPAGKSLADIPDAAKAGFEPVGNTAQKAFNRLLRDVTGMKPKT